MTASPDPLTGRVAPLLVDNVDTDIIIPSREMRSTGRTGFADGLFAPWRYSNAAERVENPEFVFNQPAYRGAAIMAVGANFGCGSSREHAVWALAEFGIRAIIGTGFAPIFRANCIRNGILPVTLARPDVERLAGEQATIRLAEQRIEAAGGADIPFAIEPEARQMLLEGLDAIDLTLTQCDTIAAWLAADRVARPWVYREARP